MEGGSCHPATFTQYPTTTTVELATMVVQNERTLGKKRSRYHADEKECDDDNDDESEENSRLPLSRRTRFKRDGGHHHHHHHHLSIVQLPDEIMLQVFKWMSPQELVEKVGLTCKHWQDISHDPFLWKLAHRELFGLPPEMEEQKSCEIATVEQQCIVALKKKARFYKPNIEDLREAKRSHAARLLYWACEIGSLPWARGILNVFMRDRAFVNQAITTPDKVLCKPGRKGLTPLSVASKKGHIHIVKELIKCLDLEYRMHVNQRTYTTKWDALYQAARKGHKDVVQLLLNVGVVDSVHLVDKKRRSELFVILCSYGRASQMRSWIRSGAPVADGFFKACAAGNLEMVAHLLNTGADPNGVVRSARHHERSPLNRACRAQHKEIVQLLLDSGANFNWSDGHHGHTALHEAVRVGNAEIVLMLLERGADTNALTKTGETPLAVAQKHGHAHIVELLNKF